MSSVGAGAVGSVGAAPHGAGWGEVGAGGLCHGSLPGALVHGSVVGGSATLVAPAGSAELESLPAGTRLSPGTNAAGGLMGVLPTGVLLIIVS